MGPFKMAFMHATFFLFNGPIQWELYKTNKGAWELVGNIFPNLRQAKIFMLVDISSRT